MGYIYIVINNINHKVYIGQTSTTLKQRWYEHTHTDIKSCTTQIKDSIKRNTRAYGYHWEEV